MPPKFSPAGLSPTLSHPEHVSDPPATVRPVSRDPTPAQHQAITVRDRDVCVSAGAGSGKTFVLVERFCGLVADGVDPERILTITFTEKAAREMSERIGQALGGRPAEGRRAVDGAWISTIHGFCARLLRERALEAGVDPAFEVLTDVPAARLRRAAYLAAQRGFRAARPGAYDALVERVRWGRDQGGAASVARLVFQLYDAMRAAGHRLDADPEPAGDLAADALWRPGVQVAFEQLTAALQRFMTEVAAAKRTAHLERRALDVSEVAARIAAAPLDVFRLETYHDLRALAKAGPGRAGPLGDAVRELRARAEAAAGAYAEGPARAVGGGLEDLLRRFDAEFRRLKAAASVLDFADLEERIRDLLEARDDVREEVRSRFEAVLIDEFQDTSRLQQRIVDLVRRPGAFFVVGDVKQSIYGFRHAEVAGLLGHERRVEQTGGAVVPLDVSFRTRPEVLAYVDEVFARAWAEPESEVPHQPLRAGVTFDPKDRPSIELVFGRGESLERARGQEARAVAARLATLIEGAELRGTNPLRPDVHGRPLRYRDCAVLVPATTALRFYERAFRERGIPYRVSSGRGFYGAREVVDAVHLLRVAAHAQDDVALVAFLRSPAAGLSDSALLALARARPGRAPLAEVLLDPAALADVELHPVDRARAEGAAGLVRALRALRGRRSTRDLLEGGLERSGLLDGSLLRGGDVRGFANLQKLLDVVQELERDGVTGPGEVAAILTDLRASGAREAEADVSAPDEDAVSMLTVHASKGLEWPLVVVADLGRRLPPERDPVLWSPETGVTPRLRDPDRPEEAIVPASFEALAAERKARAREESKRLLYVAMTRARDHLVLAGAQGFSARVAGDWLKWARGPLPAGPGAAPVGPLEDDPAAEAAAVLCASREQGVAVRYLEVAEETDGTPIQGPRGPATDAEPVLGARHRRDLARAVRPTLPAADPEAAEAARGLLAAVREPDLPPLDAGASVYTVSEVLTWRTCPRRALFEHVVGEPDEGVAGPGRGRGVPQRAIGTAVHEVLAGTLRPRPRYVARRLEHLLLPRAEPPEVVERAARRALALARAFDDLPLARRAGRAGDVRRELPFLVRVPGGADGEPLLLRGSIDLAFEEGAGWVVADYKASELTALEVPKRLAAQALQVQLYALALAELGLAPVEGALVYLAPGVEGPVDVGPEARAAARDALVAYARARRDLDLPPEPGAACRRCPYVGSCPEGQGPAAAAVPSLAEEVARGTRSGMVSAP